MGSWNAPIHKLRTWARLNRADRWLILRAGVLLAIVGGMLRYRGFRRTVATFRCDPLGFTSDAQAPAASQAIRQVSRAVQIAARNGLRQPNCLRNSLVLNYLLRRRGYDSELRIGVRRAGDQRVHSPDGGGRKRRKWDTLLVSNPIRG